ncbi:hypothetical protein FOZ63_009514 [Perkinsus olseni]|uniref:Uncharacterized protein n=1 Tax=Perkinsus olseni TaxID=32597 RepID=A0A7J6S1R8_PEROL|nr:hypothetical protein FOZ63_009514 [Perkinsus olseni]
MFKLAALVTAVAVVRSSVQNEVFSPGDGLLEKNVPGTSDVLPLIRLRKPRELRDEVVNSTEAGPPYERPTGDCKPAYGGVWGCACTGDEEAFGVLNKQGYLEAVVCAPYCDDSRVRGTLRQSTKRALGGSSVPESCPAPHHGRAECLSGLCFIALEGGCPPGMKGAAVQGLGKVCMYFY